MTGGITAVPGVRVGHATDTEAGTGCTVVIGPFRGAVDARGLATGSRELLPLGLMHMTGRHDAVLLTGGSAFGLAAADGVMAWLEERGMGFDAGVARVPIVPTGVIFDLGTGRADRRPDPEMGRAACDAATDGVVAEGRVGAGTGATVGKLLGLEGAMPGGLGTYAVHSLGYTVGALAVVNAFGDVLDGNGRILAGARTSDGRFLDTARALREGAATGFPPRFGRHTEPGTNTTLVVVATDAPLTRAALNSLALAGSAGVARRISPIHTPVDGDICFALSTSPTSTELRLDEVLGLGAAAAYAVEQAIERAVIHAVEA